VVDYLWQDVGQPTGALVMSTTAYWRKYQYQKKKDEISYYVGELEKHLNIYNWFSNSETWIKTIEAMDELKKLDELENFGDMDY